MKKLILYNEGAAIQRTSKVFSVFSLEMLFSGVLPMLMSYSSQARPSDLLLFLQACKAFLCQYHECLRRIVSGSW